MFSFIKDIHERNGCKMDLTEPYDKDERVECQEPPFITTVKKEAGD